VDQARAADEVHVEAKALQVTGLPVRYVKIPVPDTLTHQDIAVMQERAAVSVANGNVFILVAVPPNLSAERYERIQEALAGVVGELSV
jgi:hypothetical protein